MEKDKTCLFCLLECSYKLFLKTVYNNGAPERKIRETGMGTD